MHYVKHFDILGVETAQIPCIELQGVPNSATEGAVGLLGMDMTSEDKELYICTAVNGAIYTWKSLKDGRDGVSVTKAEIHDNGELILTLSDGVTLNAGVVKGEKGKDGVDGNPGTDGKDGVGISKVEINSDSELVVTYTDGNLVNLGKVVGDDGVGISKVESGAVSVSDGYTVTPIAITKTDGSTITLDLRVKNNIIELNTGVAMSFFIGTHEEWEAYTGSKVNVWFLPTDDTTLDDIDERFDALTLYQHKIDVSFSYTQAQNAALTRAIIVIYNNTQDEFTKEKLYSYLVQYGTKGYPVNGFTTYGANTSAKVYPLIKVFASEDWVYNELYFEYTDCVTEGDITALSSDRDIAHQYLATNSQFNLSVIDTVTKLI